jgi:DNA polymerase-3 subunit gamma/tau
MSYLVLARKYRPQNFDQVIEQSHISQTLTNAISTDRVAHAILFTGPRGTGKTTVARILAKAMNCSQGPTSQPCNSCRSCEDITGGHGVDVFEIDGASNNSVDQIRELRENIKYMPAHSAFKIYIIDEVHMLSTAAFNALLKTLEEPPAHILFMFATTEPHKIPITILSRCQRHDFRRINLDAISAHMAWICSEEKFEVDQQSLDMIAREAGGSMRDALSLLDQVMTCSRGRLTHEQVVDLLGVIDRKMIHDLAGSILTGNTAAVLDLIDDIYRRGHDMKRLYGDLLEHFRNLTVSSLGNKVDKLIDLPAAEVEQLVQQSGKTSASVINQIFDLLFKQEPVIRLSPQPKTALEITLIRILQAGPTLPIDALIDKLDDLRREIGSAVPAPSPAVIPEHISYAETAAPTHQSELSTAKPVPPHLKGESMPPAAAAEKPIVSESPASEPWKRIIETISSQNPSFAVNLAKCTLKKLADGTLEIDAPGNGFTLTMIQREKNMAILRKVCEEILGGCVDIKIEVSNDKSANHPQKKSTELRDKAVNHPLVAEAIDIFDGHLVDVKVR